MVRFVLSLHHLLPALAPFVCIVGVASDRVSSFKWGRILVVMASLLVVVTTWPGWPTGASDRELREDLFWLGDVLHGREALVDGGHVYQYYLGENYTIKPITVSHQGNSLSFREGGRYRVLGCGDVDGRMVVIQKSRQRFFGGPAEEALLGSCSRISRLTVTVYDCAPRERVGPERASTGSGRSNMGDVGG